MWITSAPVAVRAGQLIRIEGQVRVPGAIEGSLDGLMIVDSIGGGALAERIGAADGWRPFVMYRAAARDEQLTLTFVLTGMGEAWLDDVRVSVVP